MIEQLKKLSTILDSKVEPLISEIEKTASTDKHYLELLNNLEGTLVMAQNLSAIFVSLAKEVEAHGESSSNRSK